MICAHCGCENPNGIAYCRDCGMSLRAAAPRIAAPTPTPELAAAQGLIPQIPSVPTAPQGQAPPLHAPPVHAPVQPPQVSTLRSDQVVAAPDACPRCGERNPEGSRFCHSCGFALAAHPPVAQPPVAQPPVAQPPVAQPPVAAQPPVTAAPQAAPVSVVCGRCRGVADPGADFCKFCGARLGSNEPASSNRVVAAVAPPRPNVPDLAPPPAMHAPAPVGHPAPPASPVAPAAVAPAVAVQAYEVPTRAAPPAPGVLAKLVRIAKDGSEGAQHAITADVTDIGRSEGSIVLADDPYLSPRHARISLRPANEPNTPGQLVLVDLGSVNGVFVRLRAPHPLAHGDLLLLGQQVLRFEAVTELEGARGPAMQHGVLLFGSPAPVSRARLLQRTVEGLVRDVMYLVRDEFVIGRESGDRTYPEDVFMSRRHAAFKREGAGHALHDLGSSNGTFVQVHGEHTLRDGDQFRIGHHLFRVDVPDGAKRGAA